MAWRGKSDRIFIGGEWVAPSDPEFIEVVSPVTEDVVATVPSASPGDVDRAVAAARAAFDHGPWPRMSLAERIVVLTRFGDLYGEYQPTMAALVSEEMGCPITLAGVIHAGVPQMIFDSFMELAPDHLVPSVRRSAGGNALVVREPIGVVAAVVPWNVPQSVIMQKLAPALLTGCSLILKPAPETPLDAYLLAELLHRAGVPDGVVNVVPAQRESSEHLVAHPGVDKVSFTGSTAAGRRIAAICGQDLRRVTLELGGKSAAVILDDADLDLTVEALRLGSLRNSGQVCSLKTRLVVSRRREHELLDRLAGLLASMPVGDPADPATQIGPMVSARQRAVVEGYIEAGRGQGAKAVIGGGRPEGRDRGWFVEPTVFTCVTSDMRIAQEEIFGPVLSVLTYDTEDEAVAIANDSRFGLNGAVFTADLEHGVDLARRIRTGTVEINGNAAGFHAPMGGFKDSGIGRESGPEGFEPYLELKSIGIPRGFADSLAGA